MTKPSKFSPEFLQKVKDSVSLVQVVGEHVVLRKSGSNHTGLCPFHNERSPSFSVNEQKQVYFCYGCKKGGDLVSFVMEMHGLNFAEAVEELAERGNVPMPKDYRSDDGDDPEAAKRRAAQKEKFATAYKLNRFAAKFFRDQIPRQKHIADYFRKRGMDETLAQNFYLGAAPASWDALAHFFAGAKAPLPLAAELGLIKASEKKTSGVGYFDLFRNRAIFPILDLRGKVVGFGGRGGLPLPPGAPDIGGDTPKYLNSNESILFQKSKVAYGLFQAQKHIREKDEVIVVEGYFDVLALHAAGFENAVATCGTSLTPEHLKLFRKFCSKIVVFFDGDKAGVAAMDRAMETGLESGMILHGAKMPEGLDPDEVLFDPETGKKLPDGQVKMKEILAAAAPLLDLRIEDAAKHARKGAEAKTQSLKKIAHWLNLYTDPVGREVRLESVAQALQVSRSILETALEAERKGARRGPPSVETIKKSGGPRVMNPRASDGQFDPRAVAPAGASRAVPKKGLLSKREAVLVTGVVKGGPFLSIFKDAGQYLPSGQNLMDLLSHPASQAVVDRVLRGEGSGIELISGLEDPRVRAVVTEALVDDSTGDGETGKRLSEVEFRLVVKKSLASAWARFSQELKVRLRDAELSKDAKLHAELMTEYLDVQRRMKELGTFYDEE